MLKLLQRAKLKTCADRREAGRDTHQNSRFGTRSVRDKQDNLNDLEILRRNEEQYAEKITERCQIFL